MPEVEHLRSVLLAWFSENKRALPWRSNRTAWNTLLSEVMLQQTRVDQALPYFYKFITRFPTLRDFSEANQDEILFLWEGLGYYSRARNLHKTTQLIQQNFKGEIPSEYDQLLTIKGIGPYTAAAIASQVFNKPVAVVDGNVIRVLTRLHGIFDDVTKAATKKTIQQLAQEFLDVNQPGEFNEAIMELGAKVCKPRNPDCGHCPLSTACFATKAVKSDEIPYKPKKAKVPHHHIGIGVVFRNDGKLLVAKRPDEVMLGGLWEFPGGKQEANETIEQTIHREFEEEIGIQLKLIKPYNPIKHAYSHFKITLHAYEAFYLSGEARAKASSEIKWIEPIELKALAFPKANRKLIDQLLEELNLG